MKPIEVARMVHALFTKFDEAVKVERGREGDEREGEGGREGGVRNEQNNFRHHFSLLPPSIRHLSNIAESRKLS
jgi:hypothetical protein